MPTKTGHDASWSRGDRSRFHELWDRLPALTVLAALPGWGRSEWMRACDAHLTDRDDAPETRWPRGRDAARAALAETRSTPVVLFLDDILTGRDDPLWTDIARAAGPRTRIVVSTIDTPAPEIIADVDTHVLDERDLRFTAEEIDLLIAATGVPVAADTRDELVTRLRGCPVLVRQQLERLRTRRGEGIWASLAFTFERTLLDHLATLPSETRTTSAFVGMLRHASGFRRFSPQLLADRGEQLDALPDAGHFERLDALPLGAFDVDDETGQRDFVWTPAAWRGFDDLTDPAERRQRVETGLRRTEEDGRVTMRLFYLLALGLFDEADALVFDQHRRFLIFTNAETQEALLAAAPDLDAHPSLLLLASELRTRTRGANPQTIRDAALCLDAFAPPPGADALLRFRLHCRRAMAATYAGRRSVARAHLDHVVDMLDADAGSRVRRQAGRSREDAQRIAADMFLAFWSALQNDRHDMALAFVDVMREYGDPADTITQIDRITAVTEEDFAGLRSLDPAGERPEGLEFSQTAALVLIEEGDDRDAMERMRMLAARVRNPPTRSAADALLILSRVVVAPAGVERSFVDSTVARSSSFWDDGAPSSFIAYAATVAHLAAGRTAEARALLSVLAVSGTTDDDWFALTATALTELQSGAPEAALSLLERADAATSLPRLLVVSGVLSAAALARRGLLEAAAGRLDAVWQAHPAPRLLRFGLRLLHADMFALLAAAAPSVAEPVADVLAAATGDRRPVVEPAVAPLSPVERDILVLLRRGLGNADLAAARGVSHNTIRTQLRLLYRKLGVANRSEAVAHADRAQLLAGEGDL